MNKMGVRVAACGITVLLVLAGGAYAGDEPDTKGTTVEQLRAQGLKAPATQKVAVLPFWTIYSDQRRTDITTVAAYLILEREGYQMLPLWEVEKAVESDKQLEPGEPIGRQDAARIGKSLGADLVCYGQVFQLETYVKTSFLSARKKVKGSMKVSLVDAVSGDLVFWGKREDTGGGGGLVTKKATSLERRHACVMLDRLLTPICEVLPPGHKHDPEHKITEDDVMRLNEEWERIRKQD